MRVLSRVNVPLPPGRIVHRLMVEENFSQFYGDKNLAISGVDRKCISKLKNLKPFFGQNRLFSGF